MTLLEEAQNILSQLSPQKLRVAIDFMAYLQEKEATEATEELLSIPGFEDELREAKAEAEAGDVISFKAIRRDV